MDKARKTRIALRESAWLLGCIAAPVLFCTVSPEYGYDPVPSFAMILYALLSVARLAFFGIDRLGKAPKN